MEIITKTYLTTAEAGAVAITAAEGGIGYWSQIATYDPNQWDGKEVPEDYVFYGIRTDPDGNGKWDGEYREITPRVIARGLELYLQQGRELACPRHLDEADSYEADVIIQLGLFGEVIYG